MEIVELITTLLSLQEVPSHKVKVTHKDKGIEMIGVGTKFKSSNTTKANHKNKEIKKDDSKIVFQPSTNSPFNTYGVFFPEFGDDYLLIVMRNSNLGISNNKVQAIVDTLPIFHLTNKYRGWFLKLLGNQPHEYQIELIEIVNSTIPKGEKIHAWTYVGLLSLARSFNDLEIARTAFAKREAGMIDLPYNLAKVNGLNFEEVIKKFEIPLIKSIKAQE